VAEEVAAVAVIAGRAPVAEVGVALEVAALGYGAVVVVAAGLQCVVGAVAAVAPAGKAAVVGAGILIATSKVVVAGQSSGGDITAVFGTGLGDGVSGAGNGIHTV
jgi:hypothetical protein